MQSQGTDRFDIEIGDTLVEVKMALNAVRNLRAVIMDLAYALHDHPNRQGLLVLVDPKISWQRLEHEGDLAWRTLRPELVNRLSLLFVEEGKFRGYPREPSPAILSRLKEFIRKKQDKVRGNLLRPDYPSEILKILIHQWILNAGPMTASWLGDLAGCTYPTTAKALERLSSSLLRHSDRSFELESFPKDQWSSLVSRGDEVRHTLRFSDRSGQPRSADALIRRLSKLGRKNLAIGGAIGARGHYPSLDLLGTPRVDLTIHCPEGSLDTDFVKRLDPALAQSEDRDEPPALVLHVLRRKQAFFTSGTDGVTWADPVECLLDLHEARLEAQAKEFFTYLANRRKLP